MKIPYSVQGALFVPTFMGLIFLLHVTCPFSGGEGCFSETFSTPLLMPAAFMHSMWGGAGFLVQYELILIMFYWIAVGILLGFCFDIFESKEKEL